MRRNGKGRFDWTGVNARTICHPLKVDGNAEFMDKWNEAFDLFDGISHGKPFLWLGELCTV